MEKDKLNNNSNKQTIHKKDVNSNNKHSDSKSSKDFTNSKPSISSDTLTPLSGGPSFVSAAFAPEFRNLYGEKTTNALYKVSETSEKIGNMAGQSAKSTLIMLTQQTGDFGRGFKTTMDVANVAGLSASIVLGSVNRKSEKMTLKKEGIKGLKEADQKLAEINKVFKKNGLDGIPKDKAGNFIKGAKLERFLKRQKIKAGGLTNKQASEAINKCLKQGKLIAKNTKYLSKNGKLRKIRKLGTRYARRALMGSGDSGRGLQQIIMFTGATKKAIKASVKLTRMNAKTARFVEKKTLKNSLKLAIKVSNTNIVKGTKLEKGLNKVTDKGTKAEKYIHNKKKSYKNYKEKKLEKRRARRENVKNKIKNGVRKGSAAVYKNTIGKTPLGNLLSKSRKKIIGLKRKVGSSKFGKGFSWITRKIFGTFRFVVRPFIFIKKIINKIIGALIGLGLVILLFQLMIMIIMASIGLTIGDTQSTTAVARDTLNELYKADLEWIQVQGEHYSTVDVVWKDIKDYDLYNEKKANSNIDNEKFSFSQSSNCAEILSMAQVHFGYSLDKADQDEVKDYVTKLYYGSHRPIITESTYTKKVKNDDGKTEEKTYTSAIITMETTYFPKLFDCQLLTESQNNDAVVNDSNDLLMCSVDDIYIYLRGKGFSHEATCGILGNMAQESGGQTLDGINPNIDKPGCLGICSWSALDSPGRVNALKKLAKDTKRDYLSLELQLDYLMQELDGPYNSVKVKIQTSEDIVFCTEEFEKGFEGAGIPNMEARIKCAKDADLRYRKYKDDWSKLTNNGKKIAQYAITFAEKLHYTQGFGSYIGSRYIGPDLSTITTDKVGRKKGTDCSGFVASVYMHFGISVPQSTSGYSSYSAKTIKIKDIQPGDILCLNNENHHVEIYIGNGQTMGLHDQYCVTEGSGKCNKDSNISQNGLKWFKQHSGLKVYRFWK